MNVVHLIGNVGADPEIRRTQNGNAIANIRLATTEKWRDKSSGERKERVEWHRVVCFQDGLSGVIEKYVKKGDKLAITGSISTRKWQDQSGADKYTTEIVCSDLEMLGGGNGSGRDRDEHSRPAPSRQSGGYSGGGDWGDDIPFAPSVL